MRRKVSVPGFGTVWTGGLYIPGKSLVPNDGENLPALTSMLTCTAKNSHSASILTVQLNPSQVLGYCSLTVLANGQNLCLNPVSTDRTNGWFG